MDEKLFVLYTTSESLNSEKSMQSETSKPEYSLREIILFIGRQGLFSLIFSIKIPNSDEAKTYMTLRITHFKPEDPSSIMITACNVT